MKPSSRQSRPLRPLSAALALLAASCATSTVIPRVETPSAPSYSRSGRNSGIVAIVNGEWIVDQDYIDAFNQYIREGWGARLSPPISSFAYSPRPPPVRADGTIAPPGNYYAVAEVDISRKGKIEIWRGVGKFPYPAVVPPP